MSKKRSKKQKLAIIGFSQVYKNKSYPRLINATTKKKTHDECSLLFYLVNHPRKSILDTSLQVLCKPFCIVIQLGIY